ncbi:MAG: hypothetical protein GXP41_11550 [Chloroflexi bacterium]|nr:hypothetical protein [Chloroflexota bacterium]
MNVSEAKAEVFWLAFKGMPKKDQNTIVQKLLTDDDFLHDFTDIRVIESRRNEPSRPLSDYLADRSCRGWS